MSKTIPNQAVVRALNTAGPVFECDSCGERMFVRSKSGLCPMCWNGRRPLAIEEPTRPVREGMALAGILDDPAIEPDAPSESRPGLSYLGPALETDASLGPVPELETDPDLGAIPELETDL